MPSDLAGVLGAAAAALEEAAPELNRLDGFAGDGDMGVTMTAAARAVRAVLAEGAAAKEGQAALLVACGSALATKAPSTSGTLLATGLLRAAKALGQGTAGPTQALAEAFAAALGGIQARGKASVGDRTMVDALDAASNSLRAAAQDGKDWREALAGAAAAAAGAAEASADLEPKVGRASWVPQRAVGHPDAGCMMVAVVLGASAAYCGQDQQG